MDNNKLLPEVKNGFSFSCQQCGRCCAGEGEGFVFLYEKELPLIAKRLGITIQEFVTKYVDVINSEYKVLDKNLNHTKKKVFLNSMVLKQDEQDGSCVFLDSKTNFCTIYDVRPYQCRSWPLWFPLMTNEKELKEAKEKCPGFQSNSGFITKSQIMTSLLKELKTEFRFVNKMRENNNDLRRYYRYLKKIKLSRDISA